MIRVAVVEDDRICANQLRGYLESYQRDFSEAIETATYCDGRDFLRDFRGQFDLILMDVEMPRLDGLSTAQAIRKSDPEVVIIFVTNMAQYAIRGYEVDALDYVLKPVSYFAFSQRLSRAITRLKRRVKRYVSLSIRGGPQKLYLDDILYVESQGHNLLYHTLGGVYTTAGTMKQAEQDLSGGNFFRCNKGYLVSLRHVDGVRDGCAMVGDDMLLISRNRKNDFLAALADYMGGIIK